jgi:N-acetylglucosaminyldiphosphoundecaprenol N-acetyl-beta-D-mannosaminyltransferase
MQAASARSFEPRLQQALLAQPRERRLFWPGQTADFLDVNFQRTASAVALREIMQRKDDAPFAYVVTPNVHHLVRLHQLRSDLWPAYRHAWLTLCDSRILGRLALRASVDLPVVPGSDLTAHLLKEAIPRDAHIAILGGSEALVADLCRLHGLTNVSHHNPPMSFIDDPREIERAVEFVVNARARFTFLAVGSPQQEILAYRIASTGRAVGIGLCIGASLCFLTGEQHRAPVAMQRLSLEWLFRLMCNPKRMWRRYLVDGPRIFMIYRDWRRLHP